MLKPVRPRLCVASPSVGEIFPRTIAATVLAEVDLVADEKGAAKRAASHGVVGVFVSFFLTSSLLRNGRQAVAIQSDR